MTTFLEAMTTNDSTTANGAVTNSTSSNYNVDLFFLAGACRRQSEQNIISALQKSYAQDRLKTLKIIFWAGDIRQGAGERRFFKIALSWLSENHPDDIQDNLSLIPEFSRWDVIFELAMTNEILFSYIISTLVSRDHAQHGLLCKWLPRKIYATDKYKEISCNKHTTYTKVTKKKRLLYGGIAGKIMERLRLTPKQYRKILVNGTKVVEQQMCAKKWDEIDYSKVPSVALNKYTAAWYRNDTQRFKQYIEDVNAGKTKINAKAIFPSDIVKKALYGERQLTKAQETQWNNLPNWLDGKENSIIPVCDVSGSMYGMPMAVSVSLGLYISERNIGPFKNAFFTFSQNPELQILEGTLSERLNQLHDAEWGSSTNISAVFQQILYKAHEAKLPAEQMPKTILIISDMEFDNCGNLTNYEGIKELYRVSGYECPNIVFWNVNGRLNNVPVKVNDKGVALISGYSPSIMKAVLTAVINPVDVMNNMIESDRYSIVK